MTAKGAGGVMVLAVDVIGDGSAERDVLGAGGDGEKPAAGDGEVEDLRKGDAGLGGEDAGVLVKGEQTVHAGGDQETALIEEAHVAVGAAHADGQNARVETVADGGEVALPVEGDEVGAVAGVAAPGFKQSGGGGDGLF